MQVGRWREQTPPISLPAGEARRRGGGTIYASAKPPPKYDELLGCAALGGRITIRSPRRISTYGNATICEGWGAGVFVLFIVCFFYSRIIAGLKRLVVGLT